MKDLICIVCPRGCHLKVDEENGYAVTGNHCPRGAEYGKRELLSPMRTVTSTVKIEGGAHPRVSVKTDTNVPKDKIFDVMDAIFKVKVSAPVHVGDVVLPHICGTDANLVITKDMPKAE